MKYPVQSFLTNSLYNIFGHFLPFIIGLATIPKLIEFLGMERFGILSIVWALIGYFSLFDFGLSRTMTVKISDLLAQEKKSEVNIIFWTSLKLIMIATLFGAVLIYLATLFKSNFSDLSSQVVLDETFKSLKIIAFTLPAVTLTSGIKGALEAENKFYGLNLIQTLSGSLNFIVPLIVSIVHPDLFYIVLSLSFLRYFFLSIHFLYLKKTSVWISKVNVLNFKDSLPLMTSGGWFTVTNLVGPLMVYFDRFLIASMIPSASLPYYTTPFEIVNRLLIIPSSITRALFPILAAKSGGKDYRNIYNLSLKLIAAICGLIVVLGLIFGRQGLKIWLGDDFAASSFLIFAILLVGFLANALAWTPFNLIQAFQRPKLTALIHLVELPFYAVMLFTFTKSYGLVGAASSWAIRNIVDFFIMTYYSHHIQRADGKNLN